MIVRACKLNTPDSLNNVQGDLSPFFVLFFFVDYRDYSNIPIRVYDEKTAKSRNANIRRADV